MAKALVLAASVVSLAVLSRPAHACSQAYRDPFTLYDLAATVVQAKVTNVPDTLGRGDADVELTVTKALVGKPGKTVAYHTSGMCAPGFEQGSVVVAFFDQDGAPLGVAYRSAIPRALDRWKRATTRAARTQLLAALAKDKDPEVQQAATARAQLEKGLPRTKDAWNQPDPKWKLPVTEAMAKARIQALAPEIDKAIPAKTSYDGWRGKLGSCQLAVERMSCPKGATRVREVMGSKIDPSLLGTLDSLDAEPGPCWNVTCPQGFNTLSLFLSGTDGALLEIWEIPEG